MRKALSRLVLAIMVLVPAGGVGLSSAAHAAAPKWDEQNLSEMILPDLQSATLARLGGFTCLTTSMCVATGTARMPDGTNRGWAASYDGSGWSAQFVGDALGDAGYTEMYQVACSSTTMCVAVGYSATYAPNGDWTERAFASQFNGSTWTDTLMGAQAGVTYQEPYKVDCTSSGRCMAGGWEEGPDGDYAFVSTFDGSSWTSSPILTSDPNAGTAKGGSINAVSCASSSCVAAGWNSDQSYNSLPIAVTFDGSAVSSTVLPFARTDGFAGRLNTVSCPSDSFCVAGGSENYDPTAFPVPSLYEQQAGQWKAVDISAMVAQNPFFDFEVTSVDCPSESKCLAIDGRTVLTRSGGTWSSALFSLEVRDAKCASDSYCALAGFSSDADGHSVILTKSGSGSWQQSDLTSFRYGGMQLTCPADGTCIAAQNVTNLTTYLNEMLIATPEPNGPGVAPGYGSLQVSWTAPLPPGSPAVAKYVVSAAPSSKKCRWSAGASGCSITNLPAALEFTVTVVARSASGTVLATSPEVKVYAMRTDVANIATRKAFIPSGVPSQIVVSGFKAGSSVSFSGGDLAPQSCSTNDYGQCAVTVTSSNPGGFQLTATDGTTTKKKRITVR